MQRDISGGTDQVRRMKARRSLLDELLDFLLYEARRSRRGQSKALASASAENQRKGIFRKALASRRRVGR